MISRHHRILTLACAALLVTTACARSVSAAEAERIAEVLRLAPGSRVADVGAGDGEWSRELARRVGETGHVFATEVDEEEIAKIQERIADEKLDNVTVVVGDQEGTGLPENCCDALLLRMVYHHFTDPAKMRASLKSALRPGGLVAVIDIVPQTSWRDLPDVPERGGHGIPPEDLVKEMTGDGFEVVARYDAWNDDEERFCVVFRR